MGSSQIGRVVPPMVCFDAPRELPSVHEPVQEYTEDLMLLYVEESLKRIDCANGLLELNKEK